MTKHVLVIGATLLDTKGKPTAGLAPGMSNPAAIRSTRGGTARNVAENLARLGADVVLVSAVGDDTTGRQLMIQTAEAGVNLDHVEMVAERHTGSYIALLDEDGRLAVALDDVGVMEVIDAAYLEAHRDLFDDAAMVMFDGSLSEAAMAAVVRLAGEYGVPLCADPSSARLAHKLRPYLSQLHLVVPNEIEEAALCGVDLTRFALKDAGLEAMSDLLNGTTSLATSTADPIVPIRMIHDMSEKMAKDEKFIVKGAFLEGKVLSDAEIAEIAQLQNKDALYSKVLGTMLAPITGLAVCLNQVVEQMGGAAAPAAEAEAPAAE